MSRGSRVFLVVAALAAGCGHSQPPVRTAESDDSVAFADEGDGAASHPADPEVAAAEARIVAGDLPGAKSALESHLSRAPRDARALLDLGLVLELGDDLSGAEARYREALAVDPDFAEAMNNLGLLLRDSNRRDEAIALLRRAVALRPSFGEAHENLAMALEESGALGEAEAEYRLAARYSPHDPIPHTNLGFLLVRLSRKDEAIVELRRAKSLADGDVATLREVARGLREAGAPTEAVAILEPLAAASEPPSARLRVELAAAQIDARTYAEAESSLRAALAIDDGIAVAHLYLGRLLAARDDTAGARAELERAVALSGDDADVRSAAERTLSVLPPPPAPAPTRAGRPRR